MEGTDRTGRCWPWRISPPGVPAPSICALPLSFRWLGVYRRPMATGRRHRPRRVVHNPCSSSLPSRQGGLPGGVATLLRSRRRRVPVAGTSQKVVDRTRTRDDLGRTARHAWRRLRREPEGREVVARAVARGSERTCRYRPGHRLPSRGWRPSASTSDDPSSGRRPWHERRGLDPRLVGVVHPGDGH